MQNEAVFNFFCKMMKKIHLPTKVFPIGRPPQDALGFDQLEDYGKYASNFFAKAEERVLYVVRDVFLFSFCFLLLPESKDVFLIGPYLTCDVSEPELMSLLEQHDLSPTLLAPLRTYFTGMPVIIDEDRLIAQIDAICELIWDGEDSYDIKRISSGSQIRWAETKEPVAPVDNQFSSSQQRSERERELMFYVSQGNPHRAQELVSNVDESTLFVRTSDPLRNLKNYGIVLNTLLRKAAEDGGVHPMHISQLALQMAHRLEGAREREECRKLYTAMVHKYCLLVRNHSMKDYSSLVQQVILRIEKDLTANLTLKSHAAALNVNASYLSTLFKKETGMTLTDYVTHVRIENAIFLLNTTEMQVQTIAQYCGISDVNYFTKTFKRLIGKTPKEYRAQARTSDLHDTY